MSHPASESTVDRSRRSFLKRSAALAAVGLAARRPARANNAKPLRIGLIGCGGRGCGAVASALTVNSEARLTALADPFADRMKLARGVLERRAGDRGLVDPSRCFDGFDGYERLLDSGVDLIILAEPPHFRPAHIEAGIEAGVHVFAEKPMAVDAPGVRRVLAAGELATRKNVSLVSGFETRYSPHAREAVQRIHDGQIGEIISIQTTYNTGSLWHRGREPEWTEMEFQMRNWYYFTWLSGDHLVEQHVHYNDFVSWVMDDTPPVHAWGYGGRQVRTESKYGDIFDHHAVVYEFPEGVRYFAFTRQQPNCFRENVKVVMGTKGELHSGREYELRDLKGQPVWQSGKQDRHPELNCFDEMFAAIREGRPINDSVAMARSTMQSILGRMATHSGQRITWDEAMASERELAPKTYSWDADPPVLPREDGSYPSAIPGQTEVL